MLRPACPKYAKPTRDPKDPDGDVLIYKVVSRPKPARPKGLAVNFIEIPQVLGFDKDEPVITVSEDAKRKIAQRRTTPRSTAKASDPES